MCWNCSCNKNYGVINKAEHFSRRSKKVFNLCDENSIKFIDTAQAYGNAERIIGKFDSKFKIITKIWLNENPSPKEIENIESKFLKSLNSYRKKIFMEF